MSRLPIILLSAAGLGLGVAGGRWFSVDLETGDLPEVGAAQTSSAALPCSDAAPPGKKVEQEETISAILGALTEGEPLRRAHLLREALGQLQAGQFATLFRKAVALEDGRQRGPLLTAVIARWFALDPQAAAAACAPYLARYRQGRAGTWYAVEWQVYEAWIQAAPDRALADALAHPQAQWANYTASRAIRTMGGEDVALQIQRLGQLPPGTFRTTLALGLVKELAQTDPKAAAAALALVSDPKDRATMQTEILRNLAQTDFQAACSQAVTALAELPAGYPAYNLVAGVWGEAGAVAPAETLRMVEQLPASLRNRAMAAALLGWAKSDPAAALQWATSQGLDISDIKTPAGGNSCHTMMLEALSGDRGKAIDWITTQPSSPQLDDCIRSALWRSSPAEAERLLGRLTPEAVPDAADDYVATLMGSNPEAARAWVSAQSSGPTREAAIGAFVTQQTQKEASAADTFVSAWKPGPDRDAALGGAAYAVSIGQPLRGVELARQIGDAEKRENALRGVVWRWSMRDTAGARAWIAQSPDLTAAMRQSFLAVTERN